MALNGIDISHYQKGIDLSKVPCDFVIVKATQGTSYVDPEFKNNIKNALANNKFIGVYHYASSGGAVNEAKHFLNTVKDYIGKAILVLDWEKGDNSNYKNSSYAAQFLGYVKNQVGIKPVIYMSKSVCREFDWNQVAKDYPLWVAQYASNNVTKSYQHTPWTDTKGYGAWESPIIFQYSGNGRLDGYDKALDLDIAYISRDDWKELAGIPLESKNQNEIEMAPKITVEEAANNVIAGKYGNGDARKKQIEALGLNYNDVQTLVNKKINAVKSKTYVVLSKNGLRVRSTPSTADNTNIITALKYGKEVVSNGQESNGFIYITSPVKGWMAKQYLGFKK